MKKLFLAALAAFAVASCETDPGMPEVKTKNYEGETTHSLAEMRTAFAQTDAYTTVTEDIVIHGYVVGNDESGNIYKALYIQDGTSGISLNVDANELNATYKVGQEVFVELKGLAVGRYGGELQVGYEGTPSNRIPDGTIASHIFTSGTPDASRAEVQAKTATIDALSENMLNTLVRLDGVRFTGGGTLAFAEQGVNSNRTLTDANGQTITVRNSGYADFYADIMPAGKGSVTGILSRFNGAWQLSLRTKSDVGTFDGSEPEPETTTAIYKETFGAVEVAANTNVADYTAWAKLGSGASAVTYEGTSASVRKSTPGSGYEGASGGNNLFFGAAPGSFVVKGITIPASTTKFKLTFGGHDTEEYNVTYNFQPADMTVSLSADGTKWIPVTYTVSGEQTVDKKWALATANFTLAAAPTKFYIKFETSRASTVRIDDIILAEGTGGQALDLAAGSTGGGDEPGGDEPGGDEPGGDEPGTAYFTETFGAALTATGSGGAKKISVYTGWSGGVTYADSYATADIRKTTTMDEALWLPQNPDTELVISGLPANKTDIVLSFDIAAQDKNTNANTVQIFANDVKLTSPSNEFTTTNAYVTLSVAVPDGTTKLRFFSPAGNNAFRIDNIKLSIAE